MVRTKKIDVDIAFNELCAVIGKRRTSYKVAAQRVDSDEGTWDLEYAHRNGGYRIAQMDSVGTAKRSYPLTDSRLPAKAFVEACHMIIAAVALHKEGA